MVPLSFRLLLNHFHTVYYVDTSGQVVPVSRLTNVLAKNGINSLGCMSAFEMEDAKFISVLTEWEGGVAK